MSTIRQLGLHLWRFAEYIAIYYTVLNLETTIPRQWLGETEGFVVPDLQLEPEELFYAFHNQGHRYRHWQHAATYSGLQCHFLITK
jgi:hypothetical protein